jgi:hypothetical protein
MPTPPADRNRFVTFGSFQQTNRPQGGRMPAMRDGGRSVLVRDVRVAQHHSSKELT